MKKIGFFKSFISVISATAVGAILLSINAAFGANPPSEAPPGNTISPTFDNATIDNDLEVGGDSTLDGEVNSNDGTIEVTSNVQIVDGFTPRDLLISGDTVLNGDVYSSVSNNVVINDGLRVVSRLYTNEIWPDSITDTISFVTDEGVAIGGVDPGREASAGGNGSLSLIDGLSIASDIIRIHDGTAASRWLDLAYNRITSTGTSLNLNQTGGQKTIIGSSGVNSDVDIFGDVNMPNNYLNVGNIDTEQMDINHRWSSLNIDSETAANNGGGAFTIQSKDYPSNTLSMDYLGIQKFGSYLRLNTNYNTGDVVIGSSSYPSDLTVNGNTTFEGDINLDGTLGADGLYFPVTKQTAWKYTTTAGFDSIDVSCPTNTTRISCGGYFNNGAQTIMGIFPSDTYTTCRTYGHIDSPGATLRMYAYALCVPY